MGYESELKRRNIKNNESPLVNFFYLLLLSIYISNIIFKFTF